MVSSNTLAPIATSSRTPCPGNKTLPYVQETKGCRLQVPPYFLLKHREKYLSNDTSIHPKQLSRQELLLWWAAAAPAPASESNVNSTTAAGQQKDQRTT